MVRRDDLSDKKNGRLAEALDLLKELGLPKQQINDRSALTLLALLDMSPDKTWSQASAPLIGVTPIMEYIARHYDKPYAPNTRETIRRHTLHQFLQAALIIQNPDQPDRPTNSPKVVYQVAPSLLKLLKAYGTKGWNKQLNQYRGVIGKLSDNYARLREMERIPVMLENGKTIRLSAGKHNQLVKAIIEKFCPCFTPGALLVYVGDTRKKWIHFDSILSERLAIRIDEHGKMPDVVVYHKQKKWLVLIEAVTSHGPVDPKRRNELEDIFRGAKAGLVYVTAFPDRRTLMKYLGDISWETEVWVAEAPTHLIHFNGERFLGPYE